MNASALWGIFPGLPVPRIEPMPVGTRRRALGFRKYQSAGGNLKSSRADAKYLRQWVGCLYVAAREGRVYRCRCRCGMTIRLEPRRMLIRSCGQVAPRTSCCSGCPSRREARARAARQMNEKRYSKQNRED
jgi:hypothetical protein